MVSIHNANMQNKLLGKYQVQKSVIFVSHYSHCNLAILQSFSINLIATLKFAKHKPAACQGKPPPPPRGYGMQPGPTYSQPGAVLIDDSADFRAGWEWHGGAQIPPLKLFLPKIRCHVCVFVLILHPVFFIVHK